MKTRPHIDTCGRNPELGAIAIVVASLWMTLFGLAAFAVDIGYAYTNKRGLKSVTDAAVRAGMPSFAAGNSSTAITNAYAMATANGYTTGGGTNVSATTAGSNLTVSLSITQPTFFLKLFGFNSKVLTARSIGRIVGTPGPAIYSNDGGDGMACATMWDFAKGINIQGGGMLMVNGNVESAEKIHIGAPSGLCNGVNCRITGTVKTPCTFWNDSGPSVVGVAATATTVPTNPIPGFTPTCTSGTLLLPLAGVPCNPSAMCPGGCMIPNGVYCSSTGINISPTSGSSICTTGASFYAVGPITITGDGNITLNPHPSTNGVVAYSTASGGAPAIQLSNGPATLYTVNGSVFAPNGLVNVGTGTPGFNMTGTLGGQVVNISMGPNQPWTFNAPGGGGGSWNMLE
jgi:hypothetical protein